MYSRQRQDALALFLLITVAKQSVISPCSCLLPCFLQWGFTLVLQAAYQGHTNVVDLLVEQYDCPLTDVTDVSVCNALSAVLLQSYLC